MFLFSVTSVYKNTQLYKPIQYTHSATYLLTVEVRRKHTLDRLRNRAQSRGQTVSVSNDGVLSVDGNEYFCLKRGL